LVRREKYLSIKSEKNIEIKMIAVILYYTENSIGSENSLFNLTV